MGHIVLVQVRETGQGIQGDILNIIGFNVPLYFDTLFADLKGRRHLKGKVCPPNQFDDQHFYQILADELTVPALLLHLLQHGVHIKKQILLLSAAAENDVILIFPERKAKSLHA